MGIGCCTERTGTERWGTGEGKEGRVAEGEGTHQEAQREEYRRSGTEKSLQRELVPGTDDQGWAQCDGLQREAYRLTEGRGSGYRAMATDYRGDTEAAVKWGRHRGKDAEGGGTEEWRT